METICMKCQNLFSWELKKNILKCHLLKFLPRVLIINNKLIEFIVHHIFFLFLRTTSDINGRQYVPFMIQDMKEKFAFPVAFR